MPKNADPHTETHHSLERLALLAAHAGRLLLETGGRGWVARQGATLIAKGLGATEVHIRVGFASLALTVSNGTDTITRMVGVGPHGVNMSLNHAVRELCAKVGAGGMTREATEAALSALPAETPRHHWLTVCVAVGIACGSFGRLLGIDWLSFLPVFLGAAIGQGIRHHLTKAGVNGFVVAAIVASVASVTAGMLSRMVSSVMMETAMFASVLLLVPGIPALNAQTDIMEGGPTMGSARAVHVFMILVFTTVGVWLAQILLGGVGAIEPPHRGILHQCLFGAAASAGFGVLFNFNWSAVGWAAGAGAVALAVRTFGIDAGWSLEVASFVAAAMSAGFVRLISLPPLRVGQAGSALAVAGCIPMIPGSAAAHTIMGLLGLTAQAPVDAHATLLATVESGLQTVFTIGAIGAGVAIVTSFLRHKEFM